MGDGITLSDAALNYTAGTIAPGIVGAAYTNNDADATTATTLFDIDSNLDQVAIQAPPNAGTLNLTGKLGLDVLTAVGFDIYSVLRSGRSVDNLAFASLATAKGAGFFAITLLTDRLAGAATSATMRRVIDIAIP